MADVHSKATRSKNMAAVSGKNTKPELLIRMALHRLGFRYRLHDKKLPGKPDLVLPKYKTVIFVNGCFWHAHDCKLFKWPQSNKEFWREKITSNKQRDRKNTERLISDGWRIIVVWECALRGKNKEQKQDVFDRLAGDIKKPDKRTMIAYAG